MNIPIKKTKLPLKIPYSNACINNDPGKYKSALILKAAAVPIINIDMN